MDESGDISFIEVPAADVNSMSLATEQDTDGDGVGDTNDVFPVDPSEWSDNDGDNVGDNADTDDDNDGVSDVDEIAAGDRAAPRERRLRGRGGGISRQAVDVLSERRLEFTADHAVGYAVEKVGLVKRSVEPEVADMALLIQPPDQLTGFDAEPDRRVHGSREPPRRDRDIPLDGGLQ